MYCPLRLVSVHPGPGAPHNFAVLVGQRARGFLLEPSLNILAEQQPLSFLFANHSSVLQLNPTWFIYHRATINTRNKYHGDTMAKKFVKTTKTGRGSDQFMLRLPPGMRSTLSAEAERNGRSMNAEIIGRLAYSLEKQISTEGVIALSKRMDSAVVFLEELLFDIRDIDLEAFIANQHSKGTMLTRSQAIRLILRTYLRENGFMVEPPTPRD